MQPVNQRSMFAVAAELCEKSINNEIVELYNAELTIKSLDMMCKILEGVHKQAVAACTIDGYEERFTQLNPQLKNYDALPE